MFNTKIFRRHNLKAFTGDDSKADAPQRYKFTKDDGTVIKVANLYQYMDETDPEHFLGWNTSDMMRAFPLCRYDSLESALKDFGFKWHHSVEHMILNTEYTLIDPESLKCTIYFKSDSDYDQFNLTVDKNQQPHGFAEYKVGIFYDGAGK
jgi:hypothetical protein|tara:strand:- start:289 stop:738 length:450 start_codon:yes stop_codon:yes gene_type:complete